MFNTPTAESQLIWEAYAQPKTYYVGFFASGFGEPQSALITGPTSQREAVNVIKAAVEKDGSRMSLDRSGGRAVTMIPMIPKGLSDIEAEDWLFDNAENCIAQGCFITDLVRTSKIVQSQRNPGKIIFS